MTKDYDSCRAKLEELNKWYIVNKGDMNESNTRFHLIDNLLLESLGWDKINISTEDEYDEEYTDYIISLNRPTMIIEAKKEGNYFQIPIEKERLIYSINSLCKDNSDLRKAIKQVTGYCQKRGIQYGVVTNGWQIVAFMANRNDGIPPLEGKALVFSSIESMCKNFLELWQSLSKNGLESKYLYNKLIGDLLPQLPPKLSTSLHEYPGVRIRNIFQTDLQIVSELVLEDVSRNRDLETIFLEECYCKSGALSQYALVSKDILSARYNYLFDEQNPGPSVLSAVVKTGISPEILAESLSRRPILLIGDVGVGKTTFIHNLINVEAVNLFKDAITFYIDLGSQAVITSDIRKFTIDEIGKQLLDNYDIDIEEESFVKGVYDLELKRFKKGIYKSYFESGNPIAKEKEIAFLEEKITVKENHLKLSIEHISKARKKQIIIFIDNSDQRNDDTQQIAFLISQEFSEHWPMTVFLSLRPETFHRSLKSGALSGYHPKAFTISPPRVDLVIEKRLDFAKKITNGEIPLKSISEQINWKFNKLNKLIQVFLLSLKENKQLLEFIDNISGGNIRFAIDLVKSFFGSGHVNTEKIIRIFEDDDESYRIPLHEFLRAVLFGDFIYYEPDKSPISNLFDINYFDQKEHFLLPIMLGILNSSINSGDGYIEINKLYNHLQALGFTIDQIDTSLIKAHDKKLIETSARGTPISGKILPKAVRATTVGLYHLNRLCNLFSYIDAIIIDTPIFDRDIREKILDVHVIEKRIERAKIFIDYLDKAWKLLPNENTFFNWENNSNELKKSISYIEKKLNNKEN